MAAISPSSRQYDRGTKRLAYQEAGVASYWIVDPDVPAVTVIAWVDGDAVDERTVSGDDVLTVDEPFPLSLVPTDLLLPRRG